MINQFNFSYRALLPLELLQMLDSHQVWAALSRFNRLCLVLLESVSQILVTRLVLSLIYDSPLVVFIQLEDLADLKVG